MFVIIASKKKKEEEIDTAQNELEAQILVEKYTELYEKGYKIFYRQMR